MLADLVHFFDLIRSVAELNYFIWLRLRLSNSFRSGSTAGSDLSFVVCGYLFSQLLNEKVDFFYVFWKEYRLNSLFLSYSI